MTTTETSAIHNSDEVATPSATTPAFTWKRFFGFVLATAAIWGFYALWRPPLPVLQLRHVEHLGRDSGEVALTFDDAPHPLTTPMLLDSLRRNHVPATFFCISDGLRTYPELAFRIKNEGNKLANHSHYHHNLTRVAPCEYPHEVADCFATLNQLGEETRLFRPPGGGLNRAVMQYLYANDMTLAWWSNNAGDWTRPPAYSIAHDILARLRGGDVLLLHDAGVGTPQALNRIVREAKHRGLSFVTMPESEEK